MMDAPDRTDDDSPLSICRMFRRQACALGLTESQAEPVAPLASITPPRATSEPGRNVPSPDLQPPVSKREF